MTNPDEFYKATNQPVTDFRHVHNELRFFWSDKVLSVLAMCGEVDQERLDKAQELIDKAQKTYDAVTPTTEEQREHLKVVKETLENVKFSYGVLTTDPDATIDDVIDAFCDDSQSPGPLFEQQEVSSEYA